tara:strand:- start:365 stop:541 length:177 start_codon:yes stop_codon:yes gene_type:complete
MGLVVKKRRWRRGGLARLLDPIPLGEIVNNYRSFRGCNLRHLLLIYHPYEDFIPDFFA